MSLNRCRDHGTVNHSSRVLLFFLVTLLALAGCGPDPLSGRAVLSGSSTLSPLAAEAVAQWGRLHPRAETRVEAIGSDAGLERLVRYGDADFALVSRPVTEQDRDAATRSGKSLVLLPLAWDAVAIVVPASNTWALSLSRDQAVKAFTTASLWSELNAAWPAQRIHRFALGPNSGTADVFATQLLGGRKGLLFSAPEVQASEDDTILTRGVAGVDGSVGYVGWTLSREADKRLRVVALEGVKPSVETIRSAAYGLPRQLWLVTTTQTLESSPASRSLMHYLYEHVVELASTAGLIPLTDTERAAVDQTLKHLTPP